MPGTKVFNIRRYMLEDMDIEAEVKEMKQILIDIFKKMDDLLDERDTWGLMKQSEESISELYEGEPDLYSVEDLKIRFKGRERSS